MGSHAGEADGCVVMWFFHVLRGYAVDWLSLLYREAQYFGGQWSVNASGCCELLIAPGAPITLAAEGASKHPEMGKNTISAGNCRLYFRLELMTLLKALLIYGNGTEWLLPWCTLVRSGYVLEKIYQQIIFIVSCHIRVVHLLTFGNDYVN